MLWVTTDGQESRALDGITWNRKRSILQSLMPLRQRWHWSIAVGKTSASYLPGTYKSLQIGFCDIGTPSNEKGDQVYGELKRLLVQKGIPAQGIRFIHEASDSDTAKAVLFEQCRNGDVAILLGSTAKLGTGTNIQTRCAAIHHIDAPWRPDEVEQREGRGQRPGNLYPVVEIFYYVQRRTFDAYSWQILANKAKFFNQVRSSTVTSRELSYSDDSSLTYGQVKAAATGDILLLEHANVSLSVDAYSRLQASFTRARERDKQETSALRTDAKSCENDLERYQQIQSQIALYKSDTPFMTPSRQLLEKKEAQREFIAGEVLVAIKKTASVHRIGYFQGVAIFFKVNTLSTRPYAFAFNDPYQGIEVECHPQWTDADNQWRFGWKIEQFFQSVAAKIEEYTHFISDKRKKAEEFEQQAQAIFPHQESLQTALARLQALNAYIAFAARAKSEGALQKLAQMRERLLSTAPKELTERPKPKNTATFVLPPRDPNADVAPATQTQIEVRETETKGPSIEEVVRTIQQCVIGSKSTVTFGDITSLPSKKKKAKKGGIRRKPETQPDFPIISHETVGSSTQQSLWGSTKSAEPVSRDVQQLSLW